MPVIGYQGHDWLSLTVLCGSPGSPRCTILGFIEKKKPTPFTLGHAHSGFKPNTDYIETDFFHTLSKLLANLHVPPFTGKKVRNLLLFIIVNNLIYYQTDIPKEAGPNMCVFIYLLLANVPLEAHFCSGGGKKKNL